MLASVKNVTVVARGILSLYIFFYCMRVKLTYKVDPFHNVWVSSFSNTNNHPILKHTE